MNLVAEKIQYFFTDEHSENDALLIGYLSAVMDNTIKYLIHKRYREISTIGLEHIEKFCCCMEDIKDNMQTFRWEFCENLYLIRAYKNFTAKMKSVFDKRYIEDKPTIQIAAEEHCSQRAVNATLKRCREEILLQKQMEGK